MASRSASDAVGLNFLGTMVRMGPPDWSRADLTWNSVGHIHPRGRLRGDSVPSDPILRKLRERKIDEVTSVVLSSLLFVGAHVPGWIVLGSLTASTIVHISVFGVIMAIVLRYSRSVGADHFAQPERCPVARDFPHLAGPMSGPGDVLHRSVDNAGTVPLGHGVSGPVRHLVLRQRCRFRGRDRCPPATNRLTHPSCRVRWAHAPGRARAHIPFRLFRDGAPTCRQRGACALGHGVPSAQDPRRPGVVAFERGRGREGNQRVHERELVVKRADMASGFRARGRSPRRGCRAARPGRART